MFFTTQLRNSNVNTFEQNIIEQEKILNYHVREELEKASGNGGDTSKVLDDNTAQEESTKNNRDSKSGIAKLVSEFNIQKLLLVNVIDNDSKILATSSKMVMMNILRKGHLIHLLVRLLRLVRVLNRFKIMLIVISVCGSM